MNDFEVKHPRANGLDSRLVADYFVSRDSDGLVPTCEVGVTRSPPVLHASFSAIEEPEKKRCFVTRRNICHHKHLLPGVFVLLGTANPLIRIATGGTQKVQGRCFQMVKKLIKNIIALLVITSLALTGGVSQSLGDESPELYPVVETWR
ncbi:hypothetical protein [uncultured Varibaculum sp.]|uniref:hypothetical protein n=1 Tax=uncultured Varibaculum sp. TaxID=413896 RepID=UPI00280569A3|nr:hypothetical protein [uncultured Varibaculum sp.]